MNNDFNKYVKYLSSDILTIKVRERSTGRLLELNPDINDPFLIHVFANYFIQANTY